MGEQPPAKLRIKDALLDLMENTDADKISAVDLSRKAGVSRATLYRYYNSIDEVLREMSEEFLEGIRDESRYYISGDFDVKDLKKPYPAIVAVGQYVLDHKRYFLAATGPHGDGRFTYKWKKIIREFYYGKLAYEGLMKDNIDVYIEFVLAGSEAVSRYWLERRPDISPEEIAPIIQRILYGPFVE